MLTLLGKEELKSWEGVMEGLRRKEEGELERHLEGGFAWENPLLEALISDGISFTQIPH